MVLENYSILEKVLTSMQERTNTTYLEILCAMRSAVDDKERDSSKYGQMSIPKRCQELLLGFELFKRKLGPWLTVVRFDDDFVREITYEELNLIVERGDVAGEYLNSHQISVWRPILEEYKTKYNIKAS